MPTKMKSSFRILAIAVALCLPASVISAPPGIRPSSTSSSDGPSPTVPYASDDPNVPLWNQFSRIYPQAQRGTLGATILGPQNIPVELQNPSLLAPPTTDHGSMYASLNLSCSLSTHTNLPASLNAKWPFALSHNRLQTGGWARQQTGTSF